MPSSSWMEPVSIQRENWKFQTTSRLWFCHPTARSSTRSRTSGNICVRTGCRTGFLKITLIFSEQPARPGTIFVTCPEKSDRLQNENGWSASSFRAVGCLIAVVMSSSPRLLFRRFMVVSEVGHRHDLCRFIMVFNGYRLPGYYTRSRSTKGAANEITECSIHHPSDGTRAIC